MEQYIAIDLKSFYASVECVERRLDPLKTNLVVADPERTEKTICLAVTPSLKAEGISGRARLFEAIEGVRLANERRRRDSPFGRLYGSSCDADELKKNPSLAIGYITATPRMSLYVDYSTRIYKIYLNYIAPEDIHVYSIDEVFIYATPYMKLFGMTAEELARMLVRDVFCQTGITATAGIGTNMYLCKVAMDIVAKHSPPDVYGVRVASLDEKSYRRLLWDHRPITDFWRVGAGYAARLESKGLYTMGDIAKCSIGREGAFYNEDLLFSMFGVNAELLIDHAWGRESCRIADVKAYRPSENSLSSGQVLQCPYEYGKAMLVIREMADALALDLVEKRLLTDRVSLAVGYDRESLKGGLDYAGELTKDHYGRYLPKGVNGSIALGEHTSSTREITEAIMRIAKEIIDPALLVRRICLCALHLRDERERIFDIVADQIDIFSISDSANEEKESTRVTKMQEKSIQHAMIDIKKKFGKNAIFKGMNLEEGATAIIRNTQIGGHRA